METNEKKPKRPRIGENRVASADSQEYTRSDNAGATPAADNGSHGEASAERTHSEYNNGNYQQRPYGNRQGGYNRYDNNQGGYRQGGYQQRQGGYQNRQGGYNRYDNNQGGYRPRPNFHYNNDNTPAEGAAAPVAEGAENNTYQENAGYQPRQQRPYNNQGGFRQGGYQQRPYNNQGGYQQRQYGNRQQEGGYQPRQQRPYNNQGGYQQRQYGNRQQEGGYQPRQQRPYNNQGGGYQQRQGGYQNRQGGYNRQNRQQGGAFPRQGKSFTPRPKRIDYEMPVPDPNEQIRLNKFMANAGLCSRREADEFIQKGMVKVNGVVATELGTKISHSDVVEFNEKVVTLERKCYILLNKPKDCVTTSDDPNGRTTVLDLVKGACEERIYPVGRLDRNTTGVLLLTNDGDLASKLTHPKYVKKKIYHVWCDKDIAEDDMQRIADGIELEDGPIHADAISYATETDRNQAGIEIHSGRNRIVRRIFESLGYHVTKLDRVYFAGLTKKNLPRGRWRYLTQDEVNFLKMGSFE